MSICALRGLILILITQWGGPLYQAGDCFDSIMSAPAKGFIKKNEAYVTVHAKTFRKSGKFFSR